MASAPRTCRPARRSTIGILVLVTMLIGAVPADAACPASVRADSLATQSLLADMTARGAAGVDDARAIYERARRSCLDIRPARAIAAATSSRGLVPAGRRARVLGVDLISLHVAGSTGWRIDLARTASRWVGGRRVAERRRAAATLTAATWGRAATTWSADPTRLAWDPGQQSAVVSILGRSRSAAGRARAATGVRAFGVGSRAAALSRLGLLEHLRIATRVDNGAPAGSSAAARTVARNVAMRAHVRVRASSQLGWSRVDGAWSSGPTHRMLVTLASGLLRRHPHQSTASVVTRLRAALTSSPRVTFEALPTESFYPWPRDGAFDSQSVTIEVDKPAVVTLLVYLEDGALARAVSATVEPGTATLAWDGARTDGTIVDAGDYRYNVDARDPYANRVRVPGLEQFRVARDTTAPTVVSSSMRIVGTGATRRAIVAWDVDELHSPQVRSWLVLRDGERRASVRLHETLQQATVRRDLQVDPGTWRATIVFIDGSGNRAARLLGTYTVR